MTSPELTTAPMPLGEREKMLRAFSIGPKMVALIERAGITTLKELRGCEAGDVLLRIHVETGTKLNLLGYRAVENLIELADSEGMEN